MKYKMLISDFDDTLLRSDYTISRASVDAIKTYREAGGFFTISTGRMYASIKPQLINCGLDKIDIPIMNCQGALAQSSLTDEVIFETKIDNATALEWLEYVYSRGLYSQIYVDNILYVDKHVDYTKIYTDASAVKAHAVGDLRAFVKNHNCCPHKMLVMDESSNNDANILEFSSLFGHKGLDFTISHALIIEVNSVHAGKGNMAKKIVDRLGFDIKEVACIGDSQNDISMIKMVGLGAAVGNARADVKAVARLVVESNDDDGVAKFIYRLLDSKFDM